MKFKFKKLALLEYVIMSAIIIVGIALDQITKYIVTSNMRINEIIPLINGVFRFKFITNDGAAWGMLDDHRWVFMTISTVAILGMLVYLYGGLSEGRLYTVSLSVIIAGGIGNMIDRIAFGEVVDFLDFYLISFPTFNVADALVCIGAGLLILALILDIIKESREKKSDKARLAKMESESDEEDGKGDS